MQNMTTITSDPPALRAIRIIHTAAWALFAGCIVAIPVAAWGGHFESVVVLILIVLVECVILVVNGWKCPLTKVAARYTTERRDNFDIYLPLWVARYNKVIFGWLYVAGIVYSFARWKEWL